MNKEEALNDFLNSFKAALNNASIYFQEHPIFIKSVDDLEKKKASLFDFMNPIKIGFTPHSLFVDGKVLEKTRLYQELAVFFHFRKIKSIEIKDTATSLELERFLLKISLPPRTLFKEKGIEDILKNEGISGICVEGLDYYQLLNAEGQEYKEIWAHLFKDIIEKKDTEKIGQFIDSFPSLIRKFKSDDLLENDALKENILNFLGYLKNNEKDKFRQCAKEIAGLILRDKNISSGQKLEKAKEFFGSLGPDDFADILWHEVAEDDSFSTASLFTFSCLIGDRGQHDKIASSLAAKISKVRSTPANQQVMHKLKELFSSSDMQSVSGVYLSSLSSLLKNEQQPEKEVLSLDRDALCVNYRLMVLNVLAQEKSKIRLALISKKISDEWYNLIKDKDSGFFKRFLEIFELRKNDILFYDIFEPFRKQMLGFIENSILDGNMPAGFEGFVDTLTETSLPLGSYLSKIFNDNKADPYILRLFFKFFPADLPVFYDSLKKASSSVEFLRSMITSLKCINSRLSIEILKYIFSFPGTIMKIEVLKAMQEMTKYDEEFLLSLLRRRDSLLKKEALLGLHNDPKASKDALQILLCISSPFGINNKVLEGNIEIVEEANILMAARECLVALSKRRFFWNKELRRKAGQALGKIHV